MDATTSPQAPNNRDKARESTKEMAERMRKENEELRRSFAAKHQEMAKKHDDLAEEMSSLDRLVREVADQGKQNTEALNNMGGQMAQLHSWMALLVRHAGIQMPADGPGAGKGSEAQSQGTLLCTGWTGLQHNLNANNC